MSHTSSILEKHTKHYAQWDFLIFFLITALSILNGNTTVFYVIYFFWWHELIRIVIDRICYKMNKNAALANYKKTGIFSSFIQMGVYFIFIVVFFAFMTNWKNQDLIQTNMKILFFKNWFFNANLVFVAVERTLLHYTQQPLKVFFGNFTPNMLILHVSIILGIILMLFVVRNFPEIFTPNNLWGSVIIVSPFLLIRALILRFKLKYKRTIVKSSK
ncbi:hypothetical protein [Seonamhaeicola sp.]|uniref:hypothetical protein n=1 Tax=Seonamhaeicola sp. TaxID=1912245 RepID=UPI00356989A0